jgi:hypothetical protein
MEMNRVTALTPKIHFELMAMGEKEAELKEDLDCHEHVDKVSGLSFNSINYQCIFEDENYK